MAPTLHGSTPAWSTASSGQSATSAAFSPPANALITVHGTGHGSGTPGMNIAITYNGTQNLTWFLINLSNSQPGGCAVWQTIIPAARTGMTVTITTSTQAFQGQGVKAYVFTPGTFNTTTPIGGKAEGGTTTEPFNTTAFTAVSGDSLVFCFAADDEHNGGASAVLTATDAGATNDSAQSLNNHDFFVARESGPAGGSNVVFNVSNSLGTLHKINWATYEVRSGAATETGATSLSSVSTLTVSGGTVTPVVQGAIVLTVNKSLLANPGQQGAVALVSNRTITVLGRITLQQVAVLLVSNRVLTIGQVKQTHAVDVLMTAIVVLEASGVRGRTTVIETRYERPPIEHPFRVIVQEILTGEIVEWDLPVSEDFTYTRQLTGPTIMQGEFKPEIISVQELGLDGFAYWLHVEIDDQIRASAIFLPPRYEESSLKFTAEGVSAAPHYVTWTTTLSSINIDPFVVVRNIWNHVQADPRSNYGVVVSNNLSGRRLGVAAYTETEIDSEGQTVVREIAAEPYELMWWEAPNCGEQIDTLASQTPFDYKERAVWNSDKTDVLHYIDLSYPRVGTPKSDLFFNEENIIEVVPIQEPEDSYASEVIVIGAGEGTATIRGYASENFANRVKKSHVVTDKSISTKARADALAKSELGLRRGRLFEIAEIVIRAIHANASIGEYDVGDDIYVEVDIPWMISTYGAWYRIASINHQPSYDYLRLGLERSDSFRYPPV